MNIASILEQQSRCRPNALAIIDTRSGRSRTTSFEQLRSMSASKAAILAQHGLRAGDRVVLLCPLSRDFYVNLLAIFRLGAVAVLFDPSAGLQHIGRCCEMAQPQALIGSWKANLLRFASSSIRRIPLKFPSGIELNEATAAQPVAETSDRAAALLTFTSGSSGVPKAAMRSHGFLLAQHSALQRALALCPETRDLTTLPVFVLANLGSGITSVLPDADLRFPGGIDAEPVARQIQEWDIQSTVASPAFLSRIAECGREFPSFRRVFAGGGPVFPSLLARLQRVAPNAEVIVVYGSTECEPISMISCRDLTPEHLAATARGAGLPVGRPVPEIQLRIFPDRWGRPLPNMTVAEFESQCLSACQTGEIVVSGPHVLPGYLHQEGDAKTKFEVDGVRWHRTADCGYLDSTGCLWLVGSASARITDSHGTLYPLTVEAAADGCPNVRRAAVVSRNGARVLAVEWVSRPYESDRAALRERTAWAAIDETCSLPRLPMDRRHNAKVDYAKLATVV